MCSGVHGASKPPGAVPGAAPKKTVVPNQPAAPQDKTSLELAALLALLQKKGVGAGK